MLVNPKTLATFTPNPSLSCPANHRLFQLNSELGTPQSLYHLLTIFSTGPKYHVNSTVGCETRYTVDESKDMPGCPTASPTVVQQDDGVAGISSNPHQHIQRRSIET
jgi:hypothetical protein